jgi:serine/threonine-protein kinase
MGEVWEAKNAVSGTRRALKIIRPDLVGSEESRARFLREVDLVRRVQHANVVECHDPFVAQAWVVLPMELLEGETLAERLRRGTFDVDEALALVAAVARGAGAIHEAGLVHRDLKPGNVFLARSASGASTPKILDLGAARDILGERLTLTGVSVGSPSYMAPEQVAGERVLDARTDVYALGVILYACLTGRRPYENDRDGSVIAKIVARRPVAPPSRLRAEISPELDAVALRALAFQREDRYADGNELAEVLDALREPGAGEPAQHEWLSDETVSERSPVAPPRPPIREAAVPEERTRELAAVVLEERTRELVAHPALAPDEGPEPAGAGAPSEPPAEEPVVVASPSPAPAVAPRVALVLLALGALALVIWLALGR